VLWGGLVTATQWFFKWWPIGTSYRRDRPKSIRRYLVGRRVREYLFSDVQSLMNAERRMKKENVRGEGNNTPVSGVVLVLELDALVRSTNCMV